MRDEITLTEAGLADLVASRLCHDLVNPLGAIGNGVELLEMTGKAEGPEVELIRDAVHAAEARIRLFRLAFGGAAADQITSGREARIAAEGYVRQSRIDLSWHNDADIPRRQARVALLMLLCAETALPMGGQVQIAPDGDGHWHMEANGPRINVDEPLWETLRFGAPPEGRNLRAAEAHFPVLAVAANVLGQSVNYVVENDVLRLSTA